MFILDATWIGTIATIAGLVIAFLAYKKKSVAVPKITLRIYKPINFDEHKKISVVLIFENEGSNSYGILDAAIACRHFVSGKLELYGIFPLPDEKLPTHIQPGQVVKLKFEIMRLPAISPELDQSPILLYKMTASKTDGYNKVIGKVSDHDGSYQSLTGDPSIPLLVYTGDL